MKDLTTYKLDDFVQDLYFRKWVMGKLAPTNTFWEDWLMENPDKTSLIEEAKTLVIATQIEDIQESNFDNSAGIEAILKRTKPYKKWKINKLSIGIAASFLIFLGLFWVWNLKFGNNIFTEIVAKTKTETNNKSNNSLTITLNDGTVVLLKKDSKINIASDFGSKTRKVFLTGEAFFDVKKDVDRPFLVVAGGIVTKVLGTSFNVRAYANEPRTFVSVKSGQVSVYEDGKTGQKFEAAATQLLLAPNQEATFEKISGKLLKTLVEKPIIILKKSEIFSFDYNETPISTILKQLEKAYGIKIIFDADLLEACNLTATFTDELLYDKIEIICETIQARYEVIDGQIVIYAKGCK